MHELVNQAGRVVDRTLREIGIRKTPYIISITDSDERRGERLYLSAVLDERLVETEGPFSSRFDMGLGIGRKRLWGRLEWITGLSCEVTGYLFLNHTHLSPDLSQTDGLKLLAAILLITTGYVLVRDGAKRKDIASSVIDKFTQK